MSYEYKCDNHKVLSKQEEFELFEKYHANGDEQSRNKIVTHNLKFAMKCARSYISRHHNVDLNDLKGYASQGLICAIDKFDYTRNVKFITFAVWWIKANINRMVEENESLIRYPANMHREMYKIHTNQCKADETIDYASVYSNINGGVSMDQPLESNSEMTVSDILACDEDTSQDDNERSEAIMRVINKLPEIERHIILEAFGFSSGDKRPIRDIAKELNVSHENVRYIRNKALVKLKSMLKGSLCTIQ